MQEMYPTKNIILNCKISFRFQKKIAQKCQLYKVEKKVIRSKSKEKVKKNNVIFMVYTIQSVGGESDNL